MDIFSGLTKEEIEKLKEAPALVTILVGASDGKLDGEERAWSERLLRARGYSGKQELKEYYRTISEGFWAELQHEMSTLPQDVAERSAVLSSRLQELNGILAKLEPAIAHGLYKGLLGLAEETAKASGGFLRMGAISSEEHQWVKLSMLKPVAAPEGHEEENSDRFDENIWGEKS